MAENSNTGFKLIATVGIAAGAFLGIKHILNKKKEKEAAEKLAAEQLNAQANNSQTYTPPKTNVQMPPKPVTIPVPKAVVKMPKIGDNMYAGSKGANAYKTASYTTANGNIYKYYPAGQFVGTYLATEGLYTKVFVQQLNTFSIDNKQVYVLSSNLIFKS